MKEAEDDDELRALAVAFGYVMNNSKGYRSILDDAEDGQPVSEGPFGPMFESHGPEKNEGIASPPALRRLPMTMLDVWVKYARNLHFILCSVPVLLISYGRGSTSSNIVGTR